MSGTHAVFREICVAAGLTAALMVFCAQAVPAPAAEALSLAGKVKDAAGKPVAAAVVYLQRDPLVQAYTDTEGKYELKGTPLTALANGMADAVLVSHPGYANTKAELKAGATALDFALAAGETKDAQGWYEYYLPAYMMRNAEWQRIIKDSTAHARFAAKDGDRLEYLKRGLLLLAQEYSEFGGPFSSLFKEMRRDPKLADFRDLVDYYYAWRNGDGKALMLKWLRGEKLTADEQTWIPLLQVAAGQYGGDLYLYDWDIKTGVWTEKGLSKRKGYVADELDKLIEKRWQSFAGNTTAWGFKGYGGEELTRDDVDAMLQYTRHLHSVWTGYGPLTGRHIWTPAQYIKSLKSEKSNSMLKSIWSAGSPVVGDYRLLPLEAALKSPHYFEYLPVHPFTIYEPQAVMFLLTQMRCYKKGPAATDGVVAQNPPPDEEPWLAGKSHMWSSFIGKKPVLIYFPNMGDPTTLKGMGLLEHFRLVYGDKIEIVHVPCPSGPGGPQFNILGPKADFSIPGAGGMRTGSLTAPVLPEDMAQLLMDKFMMMPNFALPTYIADMGCTFNNMQGIDSGWERGCLAFVDINGKYCNKWMLGSGSPWCDTKGGHVYDEWTAVAEYFIRKLLSNGGAYDPAWKWDYYKPEFTVSVMPEAGGLAYPGKWDYTSPECPVEGSFVYVKFVNAAANTISGILIAKGGDPGFGDSLVYPPKGEDLAKLVAKGKPIEISANSARIVFGPRYAQLKDAIPETVIQCRYDKSKKSDESHPQLILLNKAQHSQQTAVRCMALTGTVTKVDVAGRKITARWIPPDTAKMYGYQLWKRGKAVVGRGHSVDAMEKFDTLDKHVQAVAANPVSVLKLPPHKDSNLWVNSDIGYLENVKEGDYLSVAVNKPLNYSGEMEVGATAVFVSRGTDFAAGVQGRLSVFPPLDLVLPTTTVPKN